MNTQRSFRRLIIGSGLVVALFLAAVSLSAAAADLPRIIIILACALTGFWLFLLFAPRIIRTPYDELREPMRGFHLFAALMLSSIIALALSVSLLDTGEGSAGQTVSGLIVLGSICCILVPLRSIYVSRKSAAARRSVYYAAAILFTLLLTKGFILSFGDDLDHRWYDAVMRWRGNRTIDTPAVAVLHLSPMPSDQKLIRLLKALHPAEIRAIVLPPRHWNDEELASFLSMGVPPNVVFNTYDWRGRTDSLLPGYSTIEAGFPAGIGPGLSNDIPMFSQPWDDWCTDLAIAAIRRAVGNDEKAKATPASLGIPFSEKRRLLINHYFVRFSPWWSSRYTLPFPRYEYMEHFYAWKDVERPFLVLQGEENTGIWIDPRTSRLVTYPRREKHIGSYSFLEPDTTRPNQYLPKSLKGKILFLGAPADMKTEYAEPWKSEAVLYATLTQNILDRDFLIEPRQLHQFLSSLLLLAAVILLYASLHPWKAFGLSLAALGVTGYVLFFMFSHSQIFFGISWFAFGFVGLTAFLLPYELIIDRSTLLEERTRLATELRAAHDMQAGLMPTADPIIPGFDISGFSKPTEEVGGDYFDYLWMNEEKTKLGIAIADVSGKAMKAAITAVMTSGMVYREIGNNQSPKEILKKINTPMYLKTARNTFTAMSIAVIDTQTKTLTLSNAGQTHPILKRGKVANDETGKANSEVIFLKVDGVRYPLGVVETAEYGELTIQLQSGDLLVFYTDGIVESTNAQKELYGFDRLEQKVRLLTNKTAKQVIEAIIADAEMFAGSQKQHDDMTVVVIRVL